MPAIEIDIDIWCAKCGTGLCNGSVATTRQGRPAFDVEPCEACLDRARTLSDDEGYDRGLKDGETESGD